MGACCSHARNPHLTSHPFKISNVDEWDVLGKSPIGNSSLAIYRSNKDGTFPDLESMNTSIHFSSDEEPLSVSKIYLCDLLPDDEQKLDSSVTIHAEYLPIIEKKKESIETIVLNYNSTKENWAEECPSAVKIDTELNPANQPSQSASCSVTNLPPDIVDKLRKLMNTDKSAAKVLAGKFVECIAKLPRSEYRKSCRLQHMLSKSLDLNICGLETNVNAAGESEANPDAADWNSSSRFTIEEGEIYAGSSTSFTSDDVSGESEVKAELKTESFDEEMKVSHVDMLQLSRQQLSRSRNESVMISESLANLTPLSRSFAKNCEDMQKDSTTDRWPIYQYNQKDHTEIDRLDAEISQTSNKLSELRRVSVQLLLTDVGETTDSDDSEKYISTEKDISRLDKHKKKLIDERQQIITKLNSKLIQRISSVRQATEIDLGVSSPLMMSGSTAISFPSLTDICTPEVISEADESEDF